MNSNFSRNTPGEIEATRVLNTDADLSYTKGLALFGSLPGLRAYHPMTGYDAQASRYRDYSNNGVDVSVNGSVVVATHRGLVTVVDLDGTNGTYLSANDSTQVRLSRPLAACWVKNRVWVGKERWLMNKLSNGVGQYSWGIGFDALGNLLVRQSSDGTVLFDQVLDVSDKVNLGYWNYFALHYYSASLLSVFANGYIFSITSGIPASMYTGGGSPYRIGWGIDGQLTMAAIASDAGSSHVSKLLNLFHHSRYAFRLDFGSYPYILFSPFTSPDETPLDEYIPNSQPLGLMFQGAFSGVGSGEINNNSFSYQVTGAPLSNDGASVVETGESDNLAISAFVTLRSNFVALIFRYQDENNYWSAVLSGINLLLVETNAGIDINRLTIAGVSSGVEYRLLVKLLGSNISVYLGNATTNLSGSYSSAFLATETEHGVWISRNGIQTPVIDRFKIEVIDS